MYIVVHIRRAHTLRGKKIASLKVLAFIPFHIFYERLMRMVDEICSATPLYRNNFFQHQRIFFINIL
jgi:hypothetical protein